MYIYMSVYEYVQHRLRGRRQAARASGQATAGPAQAFVILKMVWVLLQKQKKTHLIKLNSV